MAKAKPKEIPVTQHQVASLDAKVDMNYRVLCETSAGKRLLSDTKAELLKRISDLEEAICPRVAARLTALERHTMRPSVEAEGESLVRRGRERLMRDLRSDADQAREDFQKSGAGYCGRVPKALVLDLLNAIDALEEADRGGYAARLDVVSGVAARIAIVGGLKRIVRKHV